MPWPIIFRTLITFYGQSQIQIEEKNYHMVDKKAVLTNSFNQKDFYIKFMKNYEITIFMHP